MNKQRIINGQIFQEEGSFAPGTLYISGERIVSETEYAGLPGDECVLDAQNTYVIPGLTDIHFHGCMGADCCDGTADAFRTIASYELSQGVTSITPATMTMSEEVLSAICEAAKDFTCENGADFCGLYMEGPFISTAKKGAQNEKYIHPADTGMLNRLQDISGNKIRTVVVAPETEGAMEFIKENAGKINISLAHTTADYETAKEALSCGASELTHLYNAMPPFTHRAPGPIGAAADDENCMVELICDGVHIHPAVVRTTFKIFGDDRIIMISDSMRAAGMEDGEYDLGGQKVIVKGSFALLEDGTLAGSVTNLMDCVRTAVQKMGIPLASAIKCAAVNPARAIGMSNDYGTLTPGKYANIVLLDQELKITQILHRGKAQA
ncbi:MAG: N-acetylglucosamine-6-phosphate deacetylase [Lachnospiraceae bacterium]|nr:N-acetylglucosamine-6-phosphate deacetylase [Lachnospiraceae bacterium]